MSSATSASSVLDYGVPPHASRFARFVTSPWLLLSLILLLAAGLRFIHLDKQSLWLDEFLALQNSTGRGQAHIDFDRNLVIESPPHLTRLADGPGLGPIWSSLGRDSHPPLYFMLLNVWRRAFGEGDFTARCLSLTFSLIAVALLFDVARLLHGKTVGLWAALLMAVAGVQIQYAQEARNYTMLLALTLAACDALVRIEKLGPSWPRAVAFGASLIAMLLTHYLAAWAAAGLGIYALLRLRGRALKLSLGALACAVIVFSIAWGPQLLKQSSKLPGELAFTLETPQGHLWRETRRAAILPMRYFIQPMNRDFMLGQASVVLYALPLLLLYWRRDLLLWCLLGAAAIIPVLISDLVRSAHGLSNVRYTFIASASAYALAAAMLWHMKGFLRWIVPMVLAISCLTAIGATYSIDKANTREMAQYIASRVGSNDILLIHTLPGHDWQARALYLGISHYSPPPCPVLFIGDPPSPSLSRRITEAKRIWICAPSNGIPLDEILPGAQMDEAMLFPYVGMIQRVRWSPAGS